MKLTGQKEHSPPQLGRNWIELLLLPVLLPRIGEKCDGLDENRC